MYDSMSALLFDPAGWLGAWRRRHSLLVQRRKGAASREERLYRERLLQTEREYVRQAMEAYARRRG